MAISSVCTQPRLFAKLNIDETHLYYSCIVSLAEVQLRRTLQGFEGVQLFIDGTKAFVHFRDLETCKFVLQRHRFIDVVPGQYEWNLRMKIPKMYSKLDDMPDYIVVVENIPQHISSDIVFMELSVFGEVYGMKRDLTQAYVKFDTIEGAIKAINTQQLGMMTFREFQPRVKKA